MNNSLRLTKKLKGASLKVEFLATIWNNTGHTKECKMVKSSKASLVQSCSSCGRDTRAKNGICAVCWGSQLRSSKGSKHLPQKTIGIRVVTEFPSGRRTERIVTLDVIGLKSERLVSKLDAEVFEIRLGLVSSDSDELYHGSSRDDV